MFEFLAPNYQHQSIEFKQTSLVIIVCQAQQIVMIFQHCVRQCFKRFKALMIIDAHHLISLFLPLLEDLSGCTLAFWWQVVTFAKNVLYIEVCVEEPSSQPFLGSNWPLGGEELLLPLISGQIEKKVQQSRQPNYEVRPVTLAQG